MAKTVRKYFEYPDERREWAVSGDSGSVSFWVCPKVALGEEYYGGVEYHYNGRSKPDYLGKEPSRDNCHLNQGKCWHDGASLWASEYWIPYILPSGEKAIWQRLEQEYDERLNKEKP